MDDAHPAYGTTDILTDCPAAIGRAFMENDAKLVGAEMRDDDVRAQHGPERSRCFTDGHAGGFSAETLANQLKPIDVHVQQAVRQMLVFTAGNGTAQDKVEFALVDQTGCWFETCGNDLANIVGDRMDQVFVAPRELPGSVCERHEENALTAVVVGVSRSADSNASSPSSVVWSGDCSSH